MQKKQPFQIVSIIIPAFNEEEFIGKCLHSIAELSYAAGRYEVIVVDNGSTDKTCEIVNSFLDILDLKIFVQKNVNIAALRNFGVSQAKGSVFAFLDADCTVSKDWLRVALPYFDDHMIGAVGSSHLTPEKISWVARTWDTVIGRKRKKGYTAKLPSGNLWVSRKIFFEIKGFNEDLITNEDFDLCYRLSEKGYRIFSDPGIKAWHWGVPKNLREFYKKNKWHGTHVFNVFLEDFSKFNNVKPLLFGFYYLVIILIIFFVFVYFSFLPALLFSVVTLSAPSLCLSWNVLRNQHKSMNSFFKLSVLYVVYGIARAHSILETMIGFLLIRK